jgi:class 3 adenylate cyclase
VRGPSGPGGSSPTWIGSSPPERLDRVVQHAPAEESDPDPALVGLGDRAMRHRGLEGGLESAERALGADLLQAEHVRRLLVDHRPQRLDLRLEFGLALGTVLVADVKQVFDVPGHHLELRHSCHLSEPRMTTH